MALGRRGGRFGLKDPDGNWIEIAARASLTGIAPK
jgi:hypothetical protein